jgi:hypothetical protein
MATFGVTIEVRDRRRIYTYAAAAETIRAVGTVSEKTNTPICGIHAA